MTGLVLTQARIDELQGYITIGDRVAYYEALASWGSDYAELALGVVRNDTVAGRTANNYMAAYAEQHSITYNSGIAEAISLDLMERDFALREDLFTNSSYTGEISGDDIEDYHDTVLGLNSFPLEAWTPYIGKEFYGDEFRDDALAGNSGWAQTFNLLLDHTLFPVTHPIQSTDPEYTTWLANTYKAGLQAIADEAAVNGVMAVADYTITTGFTLLELQQLAEVSVEKLTGIIDSLHSRAIETVGSVIGEAYLAFASAMSLASPLVLDLDGDGVETTALAGSDAVYFDHNQDGFAEASGWVDADDGILALDVNEDGLINDGSELFGNQTGFSTGFLALREYDGTGDNKITSADAVWSDLRVWIDANNDGFSQSGELHTLNSLNITEINTSFTSVNTTNNGNNVYQTGTFKINGNTNTVADVYFAVDKTNSTYNQEYTLDARTLFMPTLRGYGTLPDLHIAMSNDNTGTGNLLDLVKSFFAQDFDELFTASDIRSSIRDILYRWADIEDVIIGSRGVNVDAKELAFLEKLTGETFIQRETYYNPFPEAGEALTKAFDEALSNFTAKLMIQSAGRELFTGDFAYNPVTDAIEGTFALDTSKLDDLENEALGLANTGEREIFWTNVVRMIEYSVGTDNLSGPDQSALDDAINNSDNSLNLSGILDQTEPPSTPIVVSTGTSGDDIINGSAAKDGIQGHDGHDTINGQGGDDWILAQNGNDIITGGTGADYIEGGSGNDIYVYNAGDGVDVLEDSSGTDKILFGAGISLIDLTFARYGAYDAVINIDNGVSEGSIFIQDFFKVNMAIETLDFNGASTYALSSQNWVLYGTDLDEELRGADLGTGVNDIIFGGGGDDWIVGGDGNDILYGENGHDRISVGSDGATAYGGNGNDKIEGSIGNDTLYGDNGNDTITGGAGTDTIYGGDGNDIIDGEGGNDIVHGGNGNDLITSDDVYVYGDAGNDTITSSGAVDQYLYGGDGNDILNFGVIGNRFIKKYSYGGDGNDALHVVSAINFLDGGAGNDTYEWNVSGATTQPNGTYITDESGFDHLSINDISFAISLEKYGDDLLIYYNNYTITVTDQFANPTDFAIDEIWDDYSNTLIDMYLWIPVSGSTYTGTTGNDTVLGGGYSDILYGLAGTDGLYGYNGNDTIYGGDGSDTLDAGGQNDTLIGGTGSDQLRGGAGNDTYLFQVGDGIDTIRYEDLAESFDDVIQFTDATTWSDLHFDMPSSSYGMDIYYGTSDKITIFNQSSSGSSLIAGNETIERVVFSDTSSYSLINDISRFGNFGGSQQVNQNFTGGVDIVYTYTMADTIYTLAGNDTVHSGSGNDYIDGGDGSDWLYGESGDDTLIGGNGKDILYGGNDNDTLDGGAGDDILEGGAGADIYIFNGGHDYLKETAASTEAIQIGGSWIASDLTFVRYSSAANIGVILIDGSNSIKLDGQFQYVFEGITFSNATTINLTTQQWTTYGTSGNDTIVGITLGGSLNDIIYGLDGNDTIGGGDGNDYIDGGIGNDSMTGGLGDDIFIVDSTSDIVTESASQGTDTVYASATFTISSNVENLILTGSGNINGLAGSDNNTLTGNSGNNTLNGGGGADSMIGGLGDDIYVVDNASDIVTENASEGTDTVQTSLNNYVLGSNLENLSLTVSSNYTMTGNSLDNYIFGNNGHNIIYGLDGNDTIDGGAGNDTMYGGTGNDIYLVNSVSDTANESSGEGTDLVSSSVTFTLSSNVENLTLTGSSAINGIGNGDANILTGNSGNNTLTGNAGNDTLYGGAGTDTLSGGNDNDTLYGGDGLDTMTGGTGADTFIFEATSVFNNLDVITDFNTGQSDKLNIADILVGYTPGVSDINDFMSLSVSGGNTTISIDRDGTAGTYSSASAFKLNSITGLDVDDLLSNGNLIV